MPSRCAPPRSAPCRDVLGRSVHRETVLGSYSRGLPVARETALLTYSLGCHPTLRCAGLSCAANLPCPRHPCGAAIVKTQAAQS